MFPTRLPVRSNFVLFNDRVTIAFKTPARRSIDRHVDSSRLRKTIALLLTTPQAGTDTFSGVTRRQPNETTRNCVTGTHPIQGIFLRRRLFSNRLRCCTRPCFYWFFVLFFVCFFFHFIHFPPANLLLLILTPRLTRDYLMRIDKLHALGWNVHCNIRRRILRCRNSLTRQRVLFSTPMHAVRV